MSAELADMASPEPTPASRVSSQAIKALQALWAEGRAEVAWPFRLAAAVLDSFDPSQLISCPADAGTEWVDYRTECDRTRLPSGERRWRIRADLRREALGKFAGRDAMAVASRLNAAVKAPTPLQAMLDAIILGPAPVLADLDRERLAALITVHDWLEGILPPLELPPRSELVRAFTRADSLAPYYRMVQHGVVGREREIGIIREFIAPQPSTGPHPGPLIIYGIGGIGKSTLLSRALLDAIEADDEGRMLVGHLDMDHPLLDPERPHTLLIELARRIGNQRPELKEQAARAMRDIQERADSRTSVLEGRYGESTSNPLIRPLATLLDSAYALGVRRFVVVVDTFERVQAYGKEAAEAIVRMLVELSEDWFREARLLIAGRASNRLPTWIFERRRRPIELTALDFASAAMLLRNLLAKPNTGAEVELTDEQCAFILNEVGMSPLSVRLAARLVEVRGLDDFQDEACREELAAALRDARIEAFLFDRVLDHLPDVLQPIACPGLILRRITPDMIANVLAGPCGLQLSETQTASELFALLRKESSLVVDDDDNELRYVPELRTEALQDVLARVDPAVARAIDENAVRHYAVRDTPEARAEELYHRLRLEQPAAELDRRWLREAGRHLRTAMDELPAGSRAWLADKLGHAVDAEAGAQADPAVRARDLRRRLQRLLAAGSATEALELLHGREPGLHDVRLDHLHMQALRMAGRHQAALDLALAIAEAGSPRQRVEAWLFAALISEGMSALQQARHYGERAAGLVPNAQPILALRVEVVLSRLDRRLGLAVAAERIITLATQCRRELDSYPVLLAEVVAEVGARDQELLRYAIERLGLRIDVPAQLAPLAKAVAELARRGLFQLSSSEMAIAQESGAGDAHGVEGISAILQTDRGESFARRCASALSEPDIGIALAALEQFFRAGVDASVFKGKRGDLPEGNVDADLAQYLVNALARIFSFGELRQLMSFRLNIEIDHIVSPSQSFVQIVSDVVDWVARENRLPALLAAAIDSRPDAAELQHLAGRLGYSGFQKSKEQTLEQLVARRAGLVDFAKFQGQLGRLITYVCWVQAGRHGGTGFLVGPDLVLTCHHVIADLLASPDAKAECIFDVDRSPKAEAQDPGERIAFAPDWLVAASPHARADESLGAPTEPAQLDYALIRVATAIGRRPVGLNPEPRAPPRGWLVLPERPTRPIARDMLMVLGHPDGENARLCIGEVVGYDAHGTRLQHTAETLAGSSGSLCLDLELAPMAIHQRRRAPHPGDDGKAVNWAIPLDLVCADVRRLIPEIWDAMRRPDGLREARITETLALLTSLGGTDGVPAGVARAVVAGFEEHAGHLDADRLLATFVDKAQAYRELRDALTAAAQVHPRLALGCSAAAQLIEDGDFATADSLLSGVENALREAGSAATSDAADARLDAAEIRGLRGDAAMLRIALAEAAEHYAAASRFSEPDERQVWRWLVKQVVALTQLGSGFGDDAATERAVALLRTHTLAAPSAPESLPSAKLQGMLGTALTQLGRSQSDPSLLVEGLRFLDAALAVYSREDQAGEWASLQNNRGSALALLGERAPGTEPLLAAVNAYQEVLTIRTRTETPAAWAATMHNLGNVLFVLGDREGSDKPLLAAVEAFREALTVRTRDIAPLSWATTQNSLGTVLMTIGESETGTDTLQSAVVSFRTALIERTRERVPLQWAATMNNLGNALQLIADRGGGAAQLEEAVAAYRTVLAEPIRAREPLLWSKIQTNLGGALTRLFARTGDYHLLEAAVAAHCEAMTEGTREHAALHWATIQSRLGEALAARGIRRRDPSVLDEALQAFDAALLEQSRERVPLEWAKTQAKRGDALAALAAIAPKVELIAAARDAYRAALSELSEQRTPLEYRSAAAGLDYVLALAQSIR